MRRVGKGGFQVFAPSIRPNIYSPIGVEDVIERHGEKALWFRMQPCPCPAEQRRPDCGLCVDGYVKTFQESARIERERCKVDGQLLHPRYSPVVSVESVEHFSTVPRALTVKRMHADNSVEVAETLRYWHAVDITYQVGLIEEETVEAEGTGDFRVRFPVKGVISSIREIYRMSEDGQAQPLQPAGMTFDSIVFSARVYGRVRSVLRVFPPVPVAYRVLGIDGGKTMRAGLPGETGDLDLIVGQHLMMGEGDIVTFLTSEFRTSQYVPFSPGPDDLLSYAPISGIINVISKERRSGGREVLREHVFGEEYIQLSSERIRWIGEKPRSGYTIMYTYHPSFRVQPHVESGGNMDRRLPRQYRARACSSYNVR